MVATTKRRARWVMRVVPLPAQTIERHLGIGGSAVSSEPQRDPDHYAVSKLAMGNLSGA